MSDSEISSKVDEIMKKDLSDINCEILPNRSGQGQKSQEFDHLFKLIVIGDSGVGKSCLMHRVTTNEFMEEHDVTVGVEFGTLLLKIDDIRVKLQIWDTAGQENFQSVTKIFYRGAHAVFLTYNITSMDSFKNMDMWYTEVKSQSEKDALCFLIANQKDREMEREVGLDKAEKFK